MQQRKCNFPEKVFRESKDLFTIKRMNSVTDVHESPEFISEMIAERSEQTSSSAPIHVNPKFLELNWQNQGNICDTKHISSVDRKPCFCFVGQECVSGKLLGQNKSVGWQPCPPENSRNLRCSASLQSESSACTGVASQNLRCSTIPQSESSACTGGATHAVKISVCSEKNADSKSYANQSVNVTHKTLKSISVYINPNFTQTHHLSAVKSEMSGNGYLQENQNTNSCHNKTTRSMFVNPKFSHLETFQSPQMVGESKMGKRLVLPRVELNKTDKHVYVNPKFSHLKKLQSPQMVGDSKMVGKHLVSPNLKLVNKADRCVYVNPKFSHLETLQSPQMVGECKMGKRLVLPRVELNKTDKHVYVNPKFSHLKKLQSPQMVGDSKMVGKHHISPNLKLVSKADKHVYVNPKFSHLETSQSPQMVGECKMVGKHLVSPHVKLLNKAEKHVNVNPQHVVPKHRSSPEQSVCRVSAFSSNSLKLPNLSSCTKVSQLPDLKSVKSDTNGTLSAFIDQLTDSRVSDICKKVVAENLNVSLTPNVANKRFASNKVHSKSEILLSKTKPVHSSVKCAVKRTREEQQNAFVSIGSKKLVRRRSVSLPRKVMKTCEQSSILKVSSGRSVLHPPMGLKSIRTKYKIVKNSPVCDPSLPLEMASHPSSSSMKLSRCSLAANSSSSVASSRSTENSSALFRKTVHHNSLLLLSKTKLIRSNVVKSTAKESIADAQTVTISNNARKLVRQRSSVRRTSVAKLAQRKVVLPPVVRMARSVRTKYKYVRSLSVQKDRMGCEVPRHSSRARQCLKSMYRIDRRVQFSPRAARRQRRYRVNYEGMQWPSQARPHARKRNIASQRAPVSSSRAWKSASYLQFRRVALARRRLQRTCSRNSRSSSGVLTYRTGGSNVVKIGGMLYRRSANQLTRTSVNTQAAAARVVRRGAHVLHMRGATFLMEPSGRTMRRIHTTATRPPVTRIDIGGVTFLQKSHNVLIRTDCHRARSFVSQAKQRSIATLTQKLKKNNQPCLFYQRFGKCLRQQKGACPRLHDPKQIAVCKKFLRGCCENAGCTLSHDVVPQKMATCRFFLEGVCVRDNCPYLHVKLSSKAAICIGFLRGYCALADKCEKRHVNVCPDWERLGECARGKSCPYPHKVGARPQTRARKRKCKPPQASIGQPAVAHRYYQELGVCRLREPSELPVVPKSSRLEPAPGYIALTQSHHDQE